MAKKPLSNMEIDRRLDALAARHGINNKVVGNSRRGFASENSEAKRSTVTVMLPSMAAVTRVAHVLADLRMAADPAYDAAAARLDRELASMLELVGADPTSLPRSKSTRAQRIRTND